MINIKEKIFILLGTPDPKTGDAVAALIVVLEKEFDNLRSEIADLYALIDEQIERTEKLSRDK